MAVYTAVVRGLLLVVPVLYQLGCATYSQQAVSMRDNLLVGRVDLAKMTAEQQDQDQNDVLACLNKGMLRRMSHDYAGSNQIFEVAKRQIGLLYGVSITDSATSLTINDVLSDYRGARYEQILLHAYMAMNYLQLGDADSARVEILQADVKMMEWGERHHEDPFVRYLAGMIFEALGEYDQALVSYRKARDSYLASRLERPLEVPLILKKDLLRMLAMQGLTNEYRRLKADFGLADYQPANADASVGEVIVILNYGLAPIKTESAVMTFSSEVQGHVRVAFPVYAQASLPVNNARIRANGKYRYLETVDNIDKLARQALDDGMPVIMARAMARAVVKYQSQKKATEQNELAGFLLTVTNLATERADTRSWTTLPHEIQMTRLQLPAGQRQIRIEIVNSAGRVVDIIDAGVDVLPGQLSFLTRHWVAPIPLKT
jgi:hypothetical protein